MFEINKRDLAQLTPAERMRGDIQRFIGSESAHVELMAARNRRRMAQQARDEEENDGEQQWELAE